MDLYLTVTKAAGNRLPNLVVSLEVTRSTRDKGTQAEAERDGKFGEETEISRTRASG